MVLRRTVNPFLNGNNVGSNPSSPTILPRQKVLGSIMTPVVRYHNDFFGTSTAMLRGGMVRDKLADL